MAGIKICLEYDCEIKPTKYYEVKLHGMRIFIGLCEYHGRQWEEYSGSHLT